MSNYTFELEDAIRACRKSFVFREATREGGDLEKAYEVNKETNHLKLSKKASPDNSPSA